MTRPDRDHTAVLLGGVAVIIALGAGGAAALWAHFWRQAGGNFDNAAKAAGPWLQLIGVLTGSLVTALVGVMNVLAARRLEQTKAAQALDVGGQLETLKNGLAGELAKVQSELARELERFKAALPARRSAYDRLFAAAHSLYYRLAELDEGQWDASKIEQATAAMEKAAALLPLVPQTYRAEWEAYWQEAVNAADGVEAIPETQGERRAYWRAHVRSLGARMARLSALGALADD